MEKWLPSFLCEVSEGVYELALGKIFLFLQLLVSYSLFYLQDLDEWDIATILTQPAETEMEGRVLSTLLASLVRAE